MAIVFMPTFSRHQSEILSVVSSDKSSRPHMSLSSQAYADYPDITSQTLNSISIKEKLDLAHCTVHMDDTRISPLDRKIVHLRERCLDTNDLIAGRDLCYLSNQGAFEMDSYLAAHLIYLFASIGSLAEANQVFTRLHEPSAFAWSAIVVAHTKLGENNEALQLYKQMRNSDILLDSHGFVAMVKSCMKVEAAYEIHAEIIESALEFDMYVGSSLIEIYMKFGCYDSAHMVFNNFNRTNIIMWNTLITGYAHHGNAKQAYMLFKKMKEEKMEPNHITYVSLLKACANISDLEQGKQIHASIIECDFETIDYVGNTLVCMYAKCGNLVDAQVMFNRLLKQDIVTWNIIISAYVQYGYWIQALEDFHKMGMYDIEPDRITYLAVLSACSSIGSLQWGREIHSHIINQGVISDLFLGSSLIDMYAKCGSIIDATVTFFTLPRSNVVAWSALLAGYVQEKAIEIAFYLFEGMKKEGVKPNEIIFSCILRACIEPPLLENGRQIHAKVIECGFESDVYLGNCLIDMYVNCGSFSDASTIFNRLPERDLVSWTSLITGYTQHGHGWEALAAFEKMQQARIKANEVTFIAVMKACASILDLDRGKRIHADLIEQGFSLGVNSSTVLVDMYCKCRTLEDALIEFNKLSSRDVMAWTTLISGYTQHECGIEALQIFKQMRQQNIEPNQITFICVLKACSSISALEQGRQVHSQLTEHGFHFDPLLGNALIDMYVKCGDLEDAHLVLQVITTCDILGWSSLMKGYALQCNYQQTFQCYECLLRTGLKPDAVTFICLLSACRHAGLLDEACSFFNSMMNQHGIMPNIEHYNTMVDLLGHVGKLIEAEDLLESLSLPSNVIGWTSLLSSCRKHGNVHLGRRCFNHLMKLDPEDAAGYVTPMSSIYLRAGLYEDAKQLEEARKKTCKWKKPAKSFIEVGTQVHSFTVGDKAHSQHEQICTRLDILMKKIEKLGYKPLPNSSYDSKDEKSHQDLLCGHSEKLALAFGLLSTPEGTTIRVSKNLRMCADCHNAFRFISKAEFREIIVVDTFCIHHFENGDCCCKENMNNKYLP